MLPKLFIFPLNFAAICKGWLLSRDFKIHLVPISKNLLICKALFPVINNPSVFLELSFIFLLPSIIMLSRKILLIAKIELLLVIIF